MTMERCKCGREFVKGTQICPWCNADVTEMVASKTKTDMRRDKLLAELDEAIAEEKDTSILDPICWGFVGAFLTCTVILAIIGIPLMIYAAYKFIVCLFSKGAKQAKLDRARDRLDAFDEKNGIEAE